jgi:hypothetical protein
MRELRLRRAKQKKGWSKIEACCKEAAKYGVCLVWIDTCCINKDSSAELSEAINSMFQWYRDAKVCLAYLEDVIVDTARENGQLSKARWFTRGWTLQELVAPQSVIFFSNNWGFIGTRSSLAEDIAEITGIDKTVFLENRLYDVLRFSVAVRFSWAANREVTRAEDRAYSLMGLFADCQGWLPQSHFHPLPYNIRIWQSSFTCLLSTGKENELPSLGFSKRYSRQPVITAFLLGLSRMSMTRDAPVTMCCSNHI